MGSEDIYTSGGGYHKPLTKKQIEEMKKRWAQSKSIRGLSVKHHEEQEVPKAEQELEEDLKKLNNQKDN